MNISKDSYPSPDARGPILAQARNAKMARAAHAYVLPEDPKLELDRVTVEEAVKSAYYLARVIGRAHARQMDKEQRRAGARSWSATDRKCSTRPGPLRPASSSWCRLNALKTDAALFGYFEAYA